ncbi:MAG: HNH endonuclease signature motif containing protein [Polaromonas sp.]
MLKPFISVSTGYLQVVFADRKKHSVHRLVAHAFCENYKPGAIVNHKNGIKTDNRASNLEWVTHAENNQHAYVSLGRKGSGAGKFGAAHQTSKAIVMTSIANGSKEFFGCALDAVRKYPVLDSGGISRCCSGKIKSHKGYKFEFA